MSFKSKLSGFLPYAFVQWYHHRANRTEDAEPMRTRPFRTMVTQTNGLLPLDVYIQLYQEMAQQPDGDIIEVGGAGGSASIASAWGRIDGNKAGSVIVIEKFEGGSRDDYGSREHNLREYKRAVTEFGVEDRIKLHEDWLTFDNGDDVLAMIDTQEVSALVIDADGRLDRDFRLFLDRLRPGGLIVIDDCFSMCDWKHQLTTRVLAGLIELQLFEPREIFGHTLFGVKPKHAQACRIDPAPFQKIVDEIWLEHGLPWESRVRSGRMA